MSGTGDAASRLDTIERAIADIAAGPRRRRRRRRGPRERGRPGPGGVARRRPRCSASWSGTPPASSACRWRVAELDRLKLPPMTAVNEDRKRHGVLRLGRRPRRHRPPASRRPTGPRTDPGARRLGDRAVRADPPGPRLPAARRRGRRAAAGRAHRGRGRPGPAGRTHAGRCDRRDRQRRRVDGPAARSCASSPTSTAWRWSRSPTWSPTGGGPRRSWSGSPRPGCPRGTASSARVGYRSAVDGAEHVALVRGEIGDGHRRARPACTPSA